MSACQKHIEHNLNEACPMLTDLGILVERPKVVEDLKKKTSIAAYVQNLTNEYNLCRRHCIAQATSRLRNQWIFSLIDDYISLSYLYKTSGQTLVLLYGDNQIRTDGPPLLAFSRGLVIDVYHSPRMEHRQDIYNHVLAWLSRSERTTISLILFVHPDSKHKLNTLKGQSKFKVLFPVRVASNLSYCIRPVKPMSPAPWVAMEMEDFRADPLAYGLANRKLMLMDH